MKRKTFIKQLMAVGISRDTASLVADQAREKRTPYFKSLGEYLNFWAILGWAARKMAIDCLLYGHAEMPAFTRMNLCPRETGPIIVTSYTPNIDGVWGRGILDSLLETDREERGQWTKANPHRCDALDILPYVCGIDLANGPDFTAGGGGHE